MSEVIVLIGAGSIGRAIARSVGCRRDRRGLPIRRATPMRFWECSARASDATGSGATVTPR